MNKFSTETPFEDKKFLAEVKREFTGLKLKLYKKYTPKLVSVEGPEIDFNMGEIHLTEIDFKALSKIMDKINKAWGTEITFCIYQSEQYPGVQLLNVRSPAAPASLSMDIKF